MAERRVISAAGAPEVAGPYSHGIEHGGVLYCAGQIPTRPGKDELIEGDIGQHTTQCLENLEAVCEEAGTSLERALMVSVFTTDLASGPQINEAYAKAFEGGDPPARAMVEVAGLPLGASVEIAAVVAVE